MSINKTMFHTYIILAPVFFITTVYWHCSGPNDHVFVNFVDHGSQWMVAFPSGIVSNNNNNIYIFIHDYLSLIIKSKFR